MNIRLEPIVFTGDIKEMFLRIGMAEPDRRYQKILCKFSPSEPIRDYILKTVVFGVTSSPFLACRTMLQLAEDCKNDFPDVAHVLETSLYIDGRSLHGQAYTHCSKAPIGFNCRDGKGWF